MIRGQRLQSQRSKVMGHEIKGQAGGQRSTVKGHGGKRSQVMRVKGHRPNIMESKVKGQRSKVTGQRSKDTGSEVKGQRG